MSSKTPVSILQEMCVRRGNPPQYDLIHDGGGSHEALFKYRVDVGPVSAVGSGRSKKEAKHDAAKNILERLKDKSCTATPEPIKEEALEVTDVLSPYRDNMNQNAVGTLQELCNANEITVPVYELVADEGPPHAKQFTIRCRVSKLEETAISRTKKQAKQQAAHKMLIRLKTSLSSELIEPSGEKVDGMLKKDYELSADVATNKYKEIGTLANRGRVPVGLKIADYHLMLKGLESKFLQQLKEEEEEAVKSAEDDPFEYLRLMLEDLKIDADFSSVETKNKGQHLILLSVATVPETVVFGEGVTEEEAYNVAARRAVDHLVLMNK